MSVLAPLYALAALAIALPVAFHFLQRRPQGRIEFSSLMFLSPSPPRWTRRNRLNHWFLLLLRAAALGLLAAAFMRPLIRAWWPQLDAPPSRRVAILLDRSASMQRAGLWTRATQEVRNVLEQLDANDEAALFTFDTRLSTEVGFSAENQPAATVASRIAQVLPGLRPGWQATDLGRGLSELVDLLQRDMPSGTADDPTATSVAVVLITDLQQGTRCQSLSTLPWPPNMSVDLRVIGSKEPNLSLRMLGSAIDEPIFADASSEVSAPSSDKYRVRVAADSATAIPTARLGWSVPGQDALELVQSVQVPPSGSRVIAMPHRTGATQLQLQGDVHPFDNSIYVVEHRSPDQDWVFIGPTSSEPDGLLYFLQRADLGTADQPLHLKIWSTEQSVEEFDFDVRKTPLILLVDVPPESLRGVLRSYLQSGGHLLWVLDPATETPPSESSPSHPAAPVLAEWLGSPTLKIEAARVSDYALLADIDFANQVFLPFADPKYNDFSRIKVWRYYRLLAEGEPPWQVLARFDDQQPALIEKSLGKGQLWVLTTSWRPAASQLALSTKFLPLLATFAGRVDKIDAAAHSYQVGESIALPPDAPWTHLEHPDGQRTPVAADQSTVMGGDMPGVYKLIGPDKSQSIAVNLAADESRTAPMDRAELERYGIPLQLFQSAAQVQHDRQQRRDQEIESRQRIWRWLLAASLAVLAVETYWARRTDQIPITASA
jgi:hypothetical protein